MATMKYTLLKLNDSNWEEWIFELKSGYKGEDLDDMLSKSTRVPNPKSKDGSDNSAECRVFKMKFGKAKSILFSALDSSEFKLITRCTSIYEMIQNRAGWYLSGLPIASHLQHGDFILFPSSARSDLFVFSDAAETICACPVPFDALSVWKRRSSLISWSVVLITLPSIFSAMFRGRLAAM